MVQHQRRVLHDQRKLGRRDRTITSVEHLTTTEREYVIREKIRMALIRMVGDITYLDRLQKGQEILRETQKLRNQGVPEELAKKQAANIVYGRELSEERHANVQHLISRQSQNFANKGEVFINHDFENDINEARAKYDHDCEVADSISPDDIDLYVPEYGPTDDDDSSFYNAEEDFNLEHGLSLDQLPDSDDDSEDGESSDGDSTVGVDEN